MWGPGNWSAYILLLGWVSPAIGAGEVEEEVCLFGLSSGLLVRPCGEFSWRLRGEKGAKGRYIKERLNPFGILGRLGDCQWRLGSYVQKGNLPS